jgi:predicted nucleic acid-binding protein
VALNRGVTVIASADTDFDRVPGFERVDPLDREAVAALAGAG